jgi:hypothetical protein
MNAIKQDIDEVIHRLGNEIAFAVRDITIRMGVIAIALFAALAALKYFG